MEDHMNLKLGLWRLWVVLTLAVSGPCAVVAVQSHLAAKESGQYASKWFSDAYERQTEIAKRNMAQRGVSPLTKTNSEYVRLEDAAYAEAAKYDEVVRLKAMSEESRDDADAATTRSDILTPIAIGFPLALGALILGAAWVRKGFATVPE
jgi:hypothetical protein